MKTYKIYIAATGIKRTLRKFKPLSAIAEYVWNGFDAEASEVHVNWESNDLGGISRVCVKDNGTGIDFNCLEEKFRPFYDTQKEADPTSHRYGISSVHGKNGYGRLTFFCFAEKAIWNTVFESPKGRHKYAITVLQDSLDQYQTDDEVIRTDEPAGTEVVFAGCRDVYSETFPEELAEYLALEFAWFLELPGPVKRQIFIGDKPLNYGIYISNRDTVSHNSDSYTFDIQYVEWAEKLHDEYSRYYFINSQHVQVGNKYTTLNQKGDGFYHSVYVKSALFEKMLPGNEDSDDTSQQQLLFDEKTDKEAFRDLQGYLHKYLSGKRKPFLRGKAHSYVRDLDQRKVLPVFGQNAWDELRKDTLKRVVEELFVLEPTLFSSLSEKQTRTLIGLLHLIIDSDERDNLFDILDQVVQLDSVQRQELADLLRRTELSCILCTIRLIEDRLRALDELQCLVAKPEYHANEVTHLQSFIERHYWMFGEQYHLVVSAEANFERALREYLYILHGEENPVTVDHPDKRKQMDIFAVRWKPNTTTIDNIVVELKHPSIKMGEKELGQVKRYMRTILDIPQFNGKDMNWEFYLVGTDYDRYIEGEIQNTKQHGEKHLAYCVDGYKVYVLKWSDVWTAIELRHQFLLDKLQLRREELLTDKQSADEIIATLSENTAVQ